MKLRITALLLCLACALAFGACGESGTPAGETHTHTPCAVCGLCTDPNCPGEESEKCKGHTPVNPPEEEAELKGMAEYFSGVKIVTERLTLCPRRKADTECLYRCARGKKRGGQGGPPAKAWRKAAKSFTPSSTFRPRRSGQACSKKIRVL